MPRRRVIDIRTRTELGGFYDNNVDVERLIPDAVQGDLSGFLKTGSVTKYL